MKDGGKPVQFMWIPRHISIKGNEVADKAPKEVLSLPGSGRTLLTLLLISHVPLNRIFTRNGSTFGTRVFQVN